jgi:membrane protease YdiL (CAAX protease family)
MAPHGATTASTLPVSSAGTASIRPTVGSRRRGVTVLVRTHPLAAFFILALALTWLVEVPMLTSPHLAPLQLVLGWMPGLAAVLVAGAAGGRAAVRALLRRLLIWRVGAGWYLVALLGPVALHLGPVALNPLLGGSGLHLPPLSLGLLAGAALQLAVRLVLSSEQLAWSGFALPRMQARHGALAASLALGALWAAWHLPLFFVPGSQRDLGFPAFLVGVVALRVVHTWVFNSTGGSVLLVALMHQATNVVTDLMGPFAVQADQTLNRWLGTAVMVGVAAALALIFESARLSRRRAPDAPAGTIPSQETGAPAPAPA